jgi:two-component system, chemotaxis family, CheB/CheR fusion protein
MPPNVSDSREEAHRAPPLAMTSQPSPIAVVGIGASAGGLQAYIEFLEALPANTGMAFVIVQHLAAEHESLLATLLSRATPMPVIEVHDESGIEPNCIYVIPPNRNMVILDGKLRLMDRAPGIHRTVDIFLEALAESYGARAIGVVLSGTGNDGMMGMQAVKAAGGITFAQDSTAVHSGMPNSAINAGCIDFVLAPREIAGEITRLASAPDLTLDAARSDVSARIEEILDLLRQRLNVDFSQYKANTLHRRIRRRMSLRKAAEVDEYKAILLADPREADALYQDILISVTNFFRNPESFETLRSTAFPALFSRERSDEPIRVWALGCSTGEEAYSLAIALQEYMDEIKTTVPVMVFGTDINDLAIERARRGWYPKAIAQDVSQSRLERFFTETDGGYSIDKATREHCIFARHNALTDPPFSNMDLVSCRNMLIYLQAGLQRKLLPLLHYALKPGGVLFLGPSETISHYRDLFDALDVRHKLYAKRPTRRRVDASFPVSAAGPVSAAHSIRKFGATPRDATNDSQREAERALLKHYVPAGVLVNAEGDILQFRGDTAPYLTPSEGKASLNLLKMAREGLLAPVRAALRQAQESQTMVRTEDVLVKARNDLTAISLTVIPVSYAPPAPRCYWILFEPPLPAAAPAPKGSRRSGSARRLTDDAERQTHVLTQELAATREYLESTIESQEASNEALQSANEEVQSANEELQSTNEELETSKEEIQSTNEELTTVNEELRIRNDELDRANNDLNNLFSSIEMAVVMLWRDLRIRRFTPLAQKAFNILPGDVGRSICDMNLKLDIDNFAESLAAAVNQGVPRESEVRSQDGRWYLLRIRPYRTQENRIDGVTIVLVDIDTLAQTQESLRSRVSELAIADRQKNEFLAILAHELRNPLAPLRNAVQILKLSPADVEVSARARELIERQVKHMSRLVGDLLDAARAQHGQIQLQRERLDVRSIVERAVDMMRPQFDARKQILRVQLAVEPVMIDGDPTRLEQVVSNLLSNAHKYTGDGGIIEVSVGTSGASDPESPQAVVRVSDNGEGIDPDLLPSLFQLFTQADRSLAHSQGGLGIGLSLVRTLVELHGGRVNAYSAGRNRGSEFVLRIPLRADRHEEGDLDDGALPAVGASQRPQRVLVVDDNPDIRESTGMMLTMIGHEVKSAASGHEALQTAAQFRPHAILLDIGLPDLSGYEVARQLRQMAHVASARIIAVSGYDTPEARDRALDAGFDHHVAKPVTLADLEELLHA